MMLLPPGDPITSRMAYPVLLSIIVYVLFNFLGIKEHGILRYLKMNLFLLR